MKTTFKIAGYRPVDFSRDIQERKRQDEEILRTFPEPYRLKSDAEIRLPKPEKIQFDYHLRLPGKFGKHCCGNYLLRIHPSPLDPDPKSDRHHDTISFDRPIESYLVAEIWDVAKAMRRKFGVRTMTVHPDYKSEVIEEAYDHHRRSCPEAKNSNSMRSLFEFKLAHYWDRRFCQTAFDKTPEQIHSLLAGQVPAVDLFDDGVFVAFSETHASPEEQVEWNRKFRPILGGYGLFAPYPNARFPKPIVEPSPSAMPEMIPSPIGEFAQSYLEAFRRGDAPVGGFAHWDALEKLPWDGSAASLDAIQDFLRSLYLSGWKVDLHDQATQNTLLLLGFHLGTQAANWARCSIRWMEWEEFSQHRKGMSPEFQISVTCWLGEDAIYAPLVPVMATLNGKSGDPDYHVRHSVQNIAKQVRA